MKKNLLVAQSGGPSSAVNATLSGILTEAIKSPEIDKVYGGVNGIYGIISRQLVELTSQMHTNEDFKLLETTPGIALGSCRFQLPAPTADSRLYDEILNIFEEYHIGYFLYLGGANSMDTVQKLGQYFREKGADIQVIGVPKTVDNDMPCTDHTPGFGSAAKFIATSMLEIIRDSEAYPISSVTIVEIMGKESGWLTAASILPRVLGNEAPHLVYLPEVPFSMGQFINDVQQERKKHRSVVIAVSEGIQFSDGTYVSQPQSGETEYTGVGQVLERALVSTIGGKVRSVVLNVLQRCSGHLLSQTDITEARRMGTFAVRHALAGETGKVMCFERISNAPYLVNIGVVPVEDILQGGIKKFPLEWISSENNDLTQQALDYMVPLIEGEVEYPCKMGMPVHFHFDLTVGK